MTDFDSDFSWPTCDGCGDDVYLIDFRNFRAQIEFKLSGFCQRCQDTWDQEQDEEGGGEG